MGLSPLLCGYGEGVNINQSECVSPPQYPLLVICMVYIRFMIVG